MQQSDDDEHDENGESDGFAAVGAVAERFDSDAIVPLLVGEDGSFGCLDLAATSYSVMTLDVEIAVVVVAEVAYDVNGKDSCHQASNQHSAMKIADLVAIATVVAAAADVARHSNHPNASDQIDQSYLKIQNL